MSDVHSREQRSYNMSRIRAGDTKPEVHLRRALHALGYRYRLHVRDLPGRPDIVLPSWRTAIFVHGCFWHGHECALFRWPATRKDFWRSKIEANRERDRRALYALRRMGWKTLVVWECAMRGPAKIDADKLTRRVEHFIRGSLAGKNIPRKTRSNASA